MEIFTPLAQIDYLVQTYQGVYTHDDIFLMEFTFAMNLVWMNYERQAYQQRLMNVQRQQRQGLNKR